MAAVLLAASLITFALVRAAPGSAVDARASSSDGGATAGPAEIERFRRAHLLDRPLWVQYLHYVGPFDLTPRGHAWFGGSGETPWGGLVCLDLGEEYLKPGVAVADEMSKRLKVTLPLMATALLLAYAIAIPLAIHGALRRGSSSERWISVASFGLYALPAFWVGVLLQSAFGARGLDLLPALWPTGASGGSSAAGADDLLRASILPVVTTAYGIAIYVARQTQAGLASALSSDWVTALRARGLSQRRILWLHALRHAALPLCVHLGQVFPALAAGSVVIEAVFDIPGVGRYLRDGLLQREYDVVCGVVLVSAVFACVGLWISDVLQAWIDPRLRRHAS